MKKKMMILLLTGAAVGILWTYTHKKPESIVEKNIPFVEISTATSKTHPNLITLSGQIEASASVSIKSRIDSVIQQVHVTDGQFVTKGQLLFTLDHTTYMAQLRDLEAKKLSELANLKKLETQFSRDQSVHKKGFLSQQAFDHSKTNVDQAKATILSLDSQIADKTNSISFAQVKAPINGVLGTIKLTAGNTVKANDTTELVNIQCVDPIHLRIPLPQKYYGDLNESLKKQNIKADITLDNGKILTSSKVLFVENQFDHKTKTIDVIIQFDNPHCGLWPGMYAQSSLTLGLYENVITIPSNAVKRGNNLFYVYTIKKGIAHYQPVSVLKILKDEALISKGLIKGEKVISDGHLKVKDKTPVKERTS